MKPRKILKSASVAMLAATAIFAFAAAPASAVAPIPGRIFALSDVGGARGDLFRTTLTGWKRLTFGLDFPEEVAADPRGKFAVLCATKTPGGTYRIYRVGANGGPVKNLIGNRRGCAPTVSPDGRKVAYIQRGPTGPSLLKVVSAKGGKPRTIYRFCGSCMYQPKWGGKRIYFERRITNDFSADSEIYSVRARDGKGLRQVTNDEGSPRDFELMDVSPDGREILAVVDDSTSFSPAARIRVLSPTGGLIRPVWTLSGPTLSDYLGPASFSPSRDVILTTSSDPLISISTLIAYKNVPDIGVFVTPPGPSTVGIYGLDWVRR